jgi:hypothetical protein
MVDVLLVYPNTGIETSNPQPPHPLMALACYLIENDVSVKIIDMRVEEKATWLLL